MNTLERVRQAYLKHAERARRKGLPKVALAYTKSAERIARL